MSVLVGEQLPLFDTLALSRARRESPFRPPDDLADLDLAGERARVAALGERFLACAVPAEPCACDPPGPADRDGVCAKCGRAA